jgi:hypothetical protein
MSVTPRCNVAGPLGQLIPTRSFARSFMHWLLSGLRQRRRA